MVSVNFQDNSMKVKAALGDAAKAFLHEAGGMVAARAANNSRVDTGQLKGSWQYKVTDDTVTIGSSLENAIWEEFGTGEYALNGDGRKGSWIYTADDGKTYRTKGKKPNRTLHKSFESARPKLINRAESIVKQRLK